MCRGSESISLPSGALQQEPRASSRATAGGCAYLSDETGRPEIYVQSFPTLTGEWKVSTEGGSQPRWRPDGKELFYVAADRTLMAVPVAPWCDISGPNRRARCSRRTSAVPSLRQTYAVRPDGQQYLMSVPVGVASPPMTVVLNWTGLLKKSRVGRALRGGREHTTESGAERRYLVAGSGLRRPPISEASFGRPKPTHSLIPYACQPRASIVQVDARTPFPTANRPDAQAESLRSVLAMCALAGCQGGQRSAVRARPTPLKSAAGSVTAQEVSGPVVALAWACTATGRRCLPTATRFSALQRAGRVAGARMEIHRNESVNPVIKAVGAMGLEVLGLVSNDFLF